MSPYIHRLKSVVLRQRMIKTPSNFISHGLRPSKINTTSSSKGRGSSDSRTATTLLISLVDIGMGVPSIYRLSRHARRYIITALSSSTHGLGTSSPSRLYISMRFGVMSKS